MDASGAPLSGRPEIFALLVARDEETRRLYAQYLTAHACIVEHAADGREALAKALVRHHHVVVLEPRLPGIDGYQLCGLLRRDPATESTPILVVSGDVTGSDIERAYRVGATAVLAKPCPPETLWSQICRLVGRSTDAPAAEQRATGLHPDETQSTATAKRQILSHVHQRGDTTAPPTMPPALVCPVCDTPLAYQRSHIGGVSARHAEQWDYYECPIGCGTFQYRHRTRKLRRAG
jgi:CheY-like chemotaxis protein